MLSLPFGRADHAWNVFSQQTQAIANAEPEVSRRYAIEYAAVYRKHASNSSRNADTKDNFEREVAAHKNDGSARLQVS
jgi:hypothetical protein